jgi:hypothetical protein
MDADADWCQGRPRLVGRGAPWRRRTFSRSSSSRQHNTIRAAARTAAARGLPGWLPLRLLQLQAAEVNSLGRLGPWCGHPSPPEPRTQRTDLLVAIGVASARPPPVTRRPTIGTHRSVKPAYPVATGYAVGCTVTPFRQQSPATTSATSAARAAGCGIRRPTRAPSWTPAATASPSRTTATPRTTRCVTAGPEEGASGAPQCEGPSRQPAHDPAEGRRWQQLRLQSRSPATLGVVWRARAVIIAVSGGDAGQPAPGWSLPYRFGREL